MDLKDVKVLVGLPTSDGKTYNAVMMSLIYQLEGFPVEFINVERQRISTARNKICNYMVGFICQKCSTRLETQFGKCSKCSNDNTDRGYTHLLFMDCDNSVEFRTLSKFIKHDKDIVTAVIRQRGEDDNVCIMRKKIEGEHQIFTKYKASEIISPNIFRVGACGMGFCLITRECVEKVIKLYGNPFIELCHSRKVVDFIEMAEIGEDLAFCIKATKLGFEIWADPSIRTEHLDLPKTLVYDGVK